MTRDEDKIDTAPVIMTDKTGVVFESLDLGVNERGEIVLSPDKPMRRPTLFMSCYGSEVLVERFICGNEHRLLGVGGQVVAAARGEAAWVKRRS